MKSQMKTRQACLAVRHRRIQGSALVIALLIVAVVGTIGATALYTSTSKYGTAFQDASWQESLQGAEAAVDVAMAGLNSGTWTGWRNVVAGSVPREQPTALGNPATGKPAVGSYNYLVPDPLLHVGEGNNTVKMYVTVDPVSATFQSSGPGWYRIRATGICDVTGSARAASDKLDTDLRKLSLVTDRVTGQAVTGGKPQVRRSIEVIAKPPSGGTWRYALTLRKNLSMSGGAWIDSFDSSRRGIMSDLSGHYLNSLLHIAPNYYGTEGNIGTLDSTGSNLRGCIVWGDLTYSGSTPVQNTGGVKGTISTPYDVPTPPVAAPTFVSGQYTSYTGGSPPFTTYRATANTSQQRNIKINGSITVPGGQSMTLSPRLDPLTGQPVDTEYIIWITGNFTTSGSGYIVQEPHVTTKYYLEGSLTVSGSSFQNQNGLAKDLQIFGVTPADDSTRTWTISGAGDFIAAVNAPNANITVSGGASFSGALVGNTINLSGSGGVHFDEALAALAGPAGSLYSYASWIEDTR